MCWCSALLVFLLLLSGPLISFFMILHFFPLWFFFSWPCDMCHVCEFIALFHFHLVASSRFPSISICAMKDRITNTCYELHIWSMNRKMCVWTTPTFIPTNMGCNNIQSGTMVNVCNTHTQYSAASSLAYLLYCCCFLTVLFFSAVLLPSISTFTHFLSVSFILYC